MPPQVPKLECPRCRNGKLYARLESHFKYSHPGRQIPEFASRQSSMIRAVLKQTERSTALIHPNLVKKRTHYRMSSDSDDEDYEILTPVKRSMVRHNRMMSPVVKHEPNTSFTEDLTIDLSVGDVSRAEEPGGATKAPETPQFATPQTGRYRFPTLSAGLSKHYGIAGISPPSPASPGQEVQDGALILAELQVVKALIHRIIENTSHGGAQYPSPPGRN